MPPFSYTLVTFFFGYFTWLAWPKLFLDNKMLRTVELQTKSQSDSSLVTGSSDRDLE